LGRLIAFGQCAAGGNWAAKKTELGDPIDWWTKWIADRPGAWPIKMFFVPHRVSTDDWFDLCTVSGIFLDRCRFASAMKGSKDGRGLISMRDPTVLAQSFAA